MLITFVASTHQAADPLTKPTPPQTSARAHAKWSFGSKESTTQEEKSRPRPAASLHHRSPRRSRRSEKPSSLDGTVTVRSGIPAF